MKRKREGDSVENPIVIVDSDSSYTDSDTEVETVVDAECLDEVEEVLRDDQSVNSEILFQKFDNWNEAEAEAVDVAEAVQYEDPIEELSESESEPETEPEPETEDDLTEYIRPKHDTKKDEALTMYYVKLLLGRPFAKQTIHPRDSRIRFEEEGHTYYIDGNCTGVVPVTELIKRFFEPFPTGLFIWRIQNARRYATDRNYEYYLKSAKEIEVVWEQKRVEGSYNHKQLELFYTGGKRNLRFWDNRMCCTDMHLENMFLDFHNYQKHNYYEPFRMEVPIFAEDCLVAGTPDIIYRNTHTGALVIGDYKFKQQLGSLGRQGLEPFEHLKDDDKTRFALQLSFYRYILETDYGYKFEAGEKGQFVVLLHKERKTTYRKVHLPYLKKEVVYMIEIHME